VFVDTARSEYEKYGAKPTPAKTNFWVMFGIFLTLLLAGCATTYQKEGFFSNGYSDSRESKDVFTVTFRANEHTPSEKVYQLALQRASELTLKHHYKYFIVLEQINSSKKKKAKQKALHYPSICLKIQCFQDPQPGAIDAEQYLKNGI
jgi:hypothetical protein